MREKIEKVLKEKVDPILEQHYGGSIITGISEDNVVMVKLTGACAQCPGAQSTLEDVVKAAVMEELPEVKDVVLDTSVSEDLIEMARKILRKEV